VTGRKISLFEVCFCSFPFVCAESHEKERRLCV